MAAYVSFGGGGELVGTNLADGSPLTKGTSYSVSSLASGVNITTYLDGRIYLSIRNPLVTPDSSNGYAPNYNNPNLDDFGTRWDKIELTIKPGVNGTAGGANLTSQDFFGLPLDLVTSGGSQAPAHLTWHADTLEVFKQLAALSNYSVITKENAARAIAVGSYGDGVTVPNVDGGDVIRIISPGSVAPSTQGGNTVYQTLAGYITYLQTGNPTNPGQPVQTQIAGNNGQIINGGPFQTYNFIATIANSSYATGGVNVSPGDLVFTGTVNDGSTGDVDYIILVPAANMTDTVIYGANPPWQIAIPAGGPNPNNIAQKVIADYFAALNFGFVGSTENNANMPPNSTIGGTPSWSWYGNQPSGQPFAKLNISTAFNAAQPGHSDRYNQFADYLVGVTDSYGFAYNDRLELPLAALSDGTVLQVSILPDSGNTATANQAH